MEEAILLEVEEDGEILVLLDGRRLGVNPGDIPTAILWLRAVSLGISEDEEDRLFDLSVRNRDSDQEIRATWLLND